MKNNKIKLKNQMAIIIYFCAFYISLNLFKGLLFDILGIAFFISFLYGMLSIAKNDYFIFG